MRIWYDDLPKLRATNRDKKIVFVSGCFDLTHAGHVLFFEDCKKHGDILIVGVGSDLIISKNKGPDRPVMNEHMRLKIIDSLKPVDYTVLDDNTYSSHSLAFVEHVLENLRPDIYAVNDDAFDLEKRVSMSNEYGINLVVLKRWCPTEYGNISTTSLIEKIKRGD